MKGLIIYPGAPPKEIALSGTLESLQSAVDGYIEAIYPFDDPVALVCNEGGKLNGMQANRALYDGESGGNFRTGEIYDIICGPFLILGIGQDDFTDLPEELLWKYKSRFQLPEVFGLDKEGNVTVFFA